MLPDQRLLTFTSLYARLCLLTFPSLPSWALIVPPSNIILTAGVPDPSRP